MVGSMGSVGTRVEVYQNCQSAAGGRPVVALVALRTHPSRVLPPTDTPSRF